jgi:hypothetical protein
MSIWKSPVFYFGIVLLLVVTAAVAAPYIVPWNNYRSDLESYGQKLTGRDVSIGGNIAVKLFPWPLLEAHDVAIGNPAGFSDDAFVKADVVRVSLSLAGLFGGTLNVESIETEKPQVNLQRNASGAVNWIFDPKEQVAGQGLLSRVKLDQIVLKGGLVSFDDLRNGHSTVFTGLDGTLSAQSILGPWRMQGDAKWQDLPFGIVVTTAAKELDQPLKFTVKLSPSALSYPLASVEGSWDGGQFVGAVRLDPQDSKGEKTSAEGTFKPLSLQAQVEASTQRMSFLKIRIAPSDRKDSGTLIEGDAVVEFGSQAQARVDLKSPRINMDTLVGSAAMRQWRDGGFLQVSNQILANMPIKLVVDFGLNISVLTSGGQALNDVRLRGSLQKEAIRVHEFAAELPGRSVGIFDGIVFPGEGAAKLGGKFKFESGDSRAFLSWLAPSLKPDVEKHWTGSRGRLQVEAGTVDWSKDQFALSDVAYTFEGASGRAALSSQFGDNPVLEINLDAGQLDIDSLVPNGWSLVRDGGLPSIMGVVAQDAEIETPERRLAFRAASVMLNGVTAKDVAVNITSRASGFEIKLLDIGNVGGARLRGGGSVVDQGSGPEGTLNFHLDAQDPRGFLRLSGLEYGSGNWTQALGQTSFDAKITAVPQKTGPELSIEARGSSGALNAELVLNARGLEKGTGTLLSASGGLNSADSAALAKLLGVSPVGAAGPGDMTFEFNGSLAQGFAFSTTLKALDAVAELSGTANTKQPYLGLTGKFAAHAPDGKALVRSIGLPIAAPPSQPFDVSAVVAAKDGGLSFIDLAGHAAGHRFSGQAGLAADGKLQGDIETDLLDMREALALAFMPWDGPVSELAQSFATSDGDGFRGDFFVRPVLFQTETSDELKEVVVGFGFETGKRQLSMSAAGAQGLKLDAVLTPRGDSQELSGTLRWPIDLARVATTKDDVALVKGSLVVEGEFKTTGRSPAAALAAVEGKGNFWLADAAFPRMTLDGFAAAVLAAKTSDALSLALAKLDSPPGTAVGQRIGNFTIGNGEVEFSAIAPTAEGLNGSITPQFDLTSGEMKIATALTLTGQPELPPVTITIAGQSRSMQARNGTSALAAKLGYELLSKEMAELERLQKEQEALAAKEDAQRKQDEQRFADYQSTRAELREYARVRRFQANEREKQAAALQDVVNAALKNSAASIKIELLRHARRLEIRRKLAVAVPVQP